MEKDKVEPNMKEQSKKYDEETAAEIATTVYPLSSHKTQDEITKYRVRARVYGIVGLVFAVISLFFYPYIAGTIGIILGLVSLRKGEIALGSWAIGISALSIILGIFVIPALF